MARRSLVLTYLSYLSYLRAHGTDVNVYGGWQTFYGNLAALPADASTALLRIASFGASRANVRRRSALCPLRLFSRPRTPDASPPRVRREPARSSRLPTKQQPEVHTSHFRLRIGSVIDRHCAWLTYISDVAHRTLRTRAAGTETLSVARTRLPGIPEGTMNKTSKRTSSFLLLPFALTALLSIDVSTATPQPGPALVQKLDTIAGAGVLENRAVGITAAVAKGVEVTQTPQGIAFSIRGAPAGPLPWVDGWTFRRGTLLTFRRPSTRSGRPEPVEGRSGNSGPAPELRFDTGGDHLILKRQ